mgnify:CR=1 FL=1
MLRMLTRHLSIIQVPLPGQQKSITDSAIVEEEVDESVYWLEIFEEVLPIFFNEIDILKKEGNELLAITVASINTAKRNNKVKS